MGTSAGRSPNPCVTHFHFHVLDPDWGHLTIKLSSQPPFPAQIIPNGHNYLERQAQKAGVPFTKEGNCFTALPDESRFAALTETLTNDAVIEPLMAVCDRWIYLCLGCALSVEEQQRCRFRYEYSLYQMEYSRNLLFRKGAQMQQVVEALVDRNRKRLTVPRLQTILGRKNRPRHRKLKPPSWHLRVEHPTYDLTIFKVHCGKIGLKIYTKGERVLRAEAMASNTRELRCGRDVRQFAQAARKLQEILERFLEALACLDGCFVSRDVLAQWSHSSPIGAQRVGSLDFEQPRLRRVARAVLALSVQPGGFTLAQVVEQVRSQSRGSPYSPRQAVYDLQKLRGQQLVRVEPGTRRYRAQSAGLRQLSAVLLLREQVLEPLLSATEAKHEPVVTKEVSPLDALYEQLRGTMQEVLHHHTGRFKEIGVSRCTGTKDVCGVYRPTARHFLADRVQKSLAAHW